MNDSVNDDTHDLRAELTDVTAPAHAASRLSDNIAPQLSEEAVPMRDAWLAFGQLIDASGPSLDEQALVRHIRLDAARRSWRRRMVVVSLAASVLLMAGVVWQRMRLSEPSVLPSGANQVADQSVPGVKEKHWQDASGTRQKHGQVASGTKGKHWQDGRGTQRSPVATSPPVKVAPSAFGSDRLAWDDQLDRRVNRMQRQVRSIKQPREAQPDPIAVLRSKIDLLGRDARSDRL